MYPEYEDGMMDACVDLLTRLAAYLQGRSPEYQKELLATFQEMLNDDTDPTGGVGAKGIIARYGVLPKETG